MTTPFGIHRYDGTDTGRLVRLVLVVQWLMTTRDLPSSEAVELVCGKLEAPGVADWLYMLNESAYAGKLTAEHSFFGLPWMDGDGSAPVANKGLPGALAMMRSAWAVSSMPGATNDYGQNVLDPLAIRLDKAAELWGYGQPARVTGAETDGPSLTWAKLVIDYKAAPARSWRWTAERKAAVEAEKKLRTDAGTPGGLEAMAGELGIKHQALSEALRRQPKRSTGAGNGRAAA